MNTATMTQGRTSFQHVHQPKNTNPSRNPLTSRENEILYLIAYEHSTKEIAKKLYVSYETVNTHRKNIMEKLGAKNAAGVVRLAFERKLLHI